MTGECFGNTVRAAKPLFSKGCLLMLWFGLFFLLVFLILLLSPLRIEIRFHHKQEQDRGTIIIKALWNLLRYRIKIPEVTWKGVDEGIEIDTINEGEKRKQEITRKKIKKYQEVSQHLVHNVDHFYRILRQFLQHLTCEKFVWQTLVGTGNAAETGVLVGALWGIKSFLLSLVGRSIKWKKPPSIHIHPAFSEAVLEFKFHSIISFRFGHAILAISRVLLQLITNRRDMKWPNIQSKV